MFNRYTFMEGALLRAYEAAVAEAINWRDRERRAQHDAVAQGNTSAAEGHAEEAQRASRLLTSVSRAVRVLAEQRRDGILMDEETGNILSRSSPSSATFYEVRDVGDDDSTGDITRHGAAWLLMQKMRQRGEVFRWRPWRTVSVNVSIGGIPVSFEIQPATEPELFTAIGDIAALADPEGEATAAPAPPAAPPPPPPPPAPAPAPAPPPPPPPAAAPAAPAPQNGDMVEMGGRWVQWRDGSPHVWVPHASEWREMQTSKYGGWYCPWRDASGEYDSFALDLNGQLKKKRGGKR
jgi:hypothetical protein